MNMKQLNKKIVRALFWTCLAATLVGQTPPFRGRVLGYLLFICGWLAIAAGFAIVSLSHGDIRWKETGRAIASRSATPAKFWVILSLSIVVVGTWIHVGIQMMK